MEPLDKPKQEESEEQDEQQADGKAFKEGVYKFVNTDQLIELRYKEYIKKSVTKSGKRTSKRIKEWVYVPLYPVKSINQDNEEVWTTGKTQYPQTEKDIRLVITMNLLVWVSDFPPRTPQAPTTTT